VPKFDNKYTLTFITVVAGVCALLLSAASSGLKPRQEANVQVDKMKNILKCLSILPENATSKQVTELFAKRVVLKVVNAKGEILNVTADEAAKIDPEAEQAKPVEQQRYPLYVMQAEQGDAVEAYCIPIFGKGLWSTLYGYLSLEKDANSVRGITFYKHGETPGLGGEIEAPWFQENFVGKKILDPEGELVSITVVKGHAADKFQDPEKLSHAVDGISGATLTSKGVTKLLDKDLRKYEAYFRTVRKGADHV